MGWIPVVRGAVLGEQQRDVDASASSMASSRAGTGSPPGPNTACQPESQPKSAAHCIQAGDTVLKPGHVHVGVGDRHAVDHEGYGRSRRRRPARWTRQDSM